MKSVRRDSPTSPWKRALKGEAGAVMVESAVSFAVFFTMLFGGIDLMRIGFQYAVINMALAEASRFAAEGFTKTGMTRQQAILQTFTDKTAKFGVTTPQNALSFCVLSMLNAGQCRSASAGNGGDWVQLSVVQPMTEHILPFPTLYLRAKAVVRNQFPKR